MKIFMFLFFTWLPIICTILAAIFFLLAFVANRKGKKFKGFRNAGFVFLGLVLLHVLILLTIGLIGIGPGLSD